MTILTHEPRAIEDALSYLSLRLGLASQPSDAEAFFARLEPESVKETARARRLAATDVCALLQEARFVSSLVASLESEPIEDGRHHPAERLLADAVTFAPGAAEWIESFVRNTWDRRPALAAALIRCLGRLPGGMTFPWGLGLAADALRHESVEVRDAAVRALEAWGGEAAVAALRVYAPGEHIGWLREYAEQVLGDLTGAAE